MNQLNLTPEQHLAHLEQVICSAVIQYHANTGIEPTEVTLKYTSFNHGKIGKKKQRGLKVSVK